MSTTVYGSHGMEKHVMNQMRAARGGIGRLVEHWIVIKLSTDMMCHCLLPPPPASVFLQRKYALTGGRHSYICIQAHEDD